MKSKFVMTLLLSGLLALSACAKDDKGTEIKTMDKAATTVKEKMAETKETVTEAVSEEVDAVIDNTSDESYVAGYVAGALKSLKDSAECQGVRDSVAKALADYKAGTIADSAAVASVKDAIATQKDCMM